MPHPPRWLEAVALHRLLRCTGFSVARAFLLHRLFRCTACSVAPPVPLHRLFRCTACCAAPPVPLHRLLRCTGFSVAPACLQPMDVIRTRAQLGLADASGLRGSLHTLASVVRSQVGPTAAPAGRSSFHQPTPPPTRVAHTPQLSGPPFACTWRGPSWRPPACTVSSHLRALGPRRCFQTRSAMFPAVASSMPRPVPLPRDTFARSHASAERLNLLRTIAPARTMLLRPVLRVCCSVPCAVPVLAGASGAVCRAGAPGDAARHPDGHRLDGVRGGGSQDQRCPHRQPARGNRALRHWAPVGARSGNNSRTPHLPLPSASLQHHEQGLRGIPGRRGVPCCPRTAMACV